MGKRNRRVRISVQYTVYDIQTPPQIHRESTQGLQEGKERHQTLKNALRTN